MPVLLFALLLLFAPPAIAQAEVASVGSLTALGVDLMDVDGATRRTACGRIARIGEPAAGLIPFLIPLLGNRTDRRHAAFAMSRLGSPAHEPLLARLTEASSWVERYWAAVGLFRSTALPDSLLTQLLRVSRTDRSGNVRELVIRVVGRIAAQPKRAVPVLTAALDDDHHGAAQAAWGALGRFGAAGWEARNAWRLENLALLESTDLRVRVRAAAKAARTGDGDEECVQDALADALRSSTLTPALKQEAMLGIGGSGKHGRWAIPLLLEALERDLSWAAAWALGRVAKGSGQEDGVVRALVRVAEGRSFARKEAIRALGRLASRRHVLARRALRKVARRTRDPAIRALAVAAFKRFPAAR